MSTKVDNEFPGSTLVRGKPRKIPFHKRHRLADNGRKKHMTPDTYNVKIAERICALMALGHSLQRIYRENGDWCPSPATIRKWRTRHRAFDDAMKQAYIDRQDHYMEEINDLMDAVKDGTLGWKEASYLTDTIKWTLTKLHPRFIEKKEGIIQVGDGGAVNFQIITAPNREALPAPSIEGEVVDEKDDAEGYG